MNKQIFEKAFKAILEAPEVNEKDIEKYFAKDYVQRVDGKEINYPQFVQHMVTLKKSLEYLTVTIQSIAQDDDVIFTHHTLRGATHAGKEVSGEVIAEFRFRNDQIYYCNELTRMTDGHAEHGDLGSRV